jgi:predicted nucleic acid-binding protein
MIFLQGADARFLVSRDLDLLELMNDDVFRTRFPHLTILTPEAFLQILKVEQQAKPNGGPNE